MNQTNRPERGRYFFCTLLTFSGVNKHIDWTFNWKLETTFAYEIVTDSQTTRFTLEIIFCAFQLSSTYLTNISKRFETWKTFITKSFQNFWKSFESSLQDGTTDESACIWHSLSMCQLLACSSSSNHSIPKRDTDARFPPSVSFLYGVTRSCSRIESSDSI